MTIREISNTAKLNVIDSVRGWAILLVIIVHTAGAMSLLPYPVKKMTNLGWYGVQLFFIASAVTLLLSMHRSLDAGKPFVVGSFFRRRFWRIAPMYYFGALFYFFMRPPEEAFSFSQLLLSLTFINSWHPDWLGVTPGYLTEVLAGALTLYRSAGCSKECAVYCEKPVGNSTKALVLVWCASNWLSGLKKKTSSKAPKATRTAADIKIECELYRVSEQCRPGARKLRQT